MKAILPGSLIACLPLPIGQTTGFRRFSTGGKPKRRLVFYPDDLTIGFNGDLYVTAKTAV
jgi:hypothetical protein